MKKSLFILLVIVIITPVNIFCQTAVDYSYDSAGNRTYRTIHVASKSASGSSFIENTTIKESIKDDTFLPELFKFYPNPTTGALEVEAPANPENIGIYSVTVTDINGKMIIDRKIESGRTILDLSGQQDGIYILRLNKICYKGFFEILDTTIFDHLKNIKIGFVFVRPNEVKSESDFIKILRNKISSKSDIAWSNRFNIN